MTKKDYRLPKRKKMQINYTVSEEQKKEQALFYPKYELVGFADLNSTYTMPVWRKKVKDNNKYNRIKL